ncbi:MAG: cation diffusion facilitator family transporter [Paludibacteraceae bacterium]|nr:cation transporter [Candidatus Physcocola equi]MCQ2233585.1 cation diffusion facilitator family transporter [Paludibacteraceae bacterium]
MNQKSLTQQTDDRQKEIVRLTLLGSVINGILIVLKFTAGILGASAAMIADAVHSLSDFLTDFIVIVMLRISAKPQDEDHDFGHGKYETLATTIIGLFLIVVGGTILTTGCAKIYDFFQGEELPSPGWLAFGAAVVSIVLKEGIYQYTMRKGMHLHSEALIANAWHHRSDALSSIGTAIGIGMACWLGNNWSILDPIAAVIVSFFIFKVALKLIQESVSQLLESSLPTETENEIERLVTNVEGVTDLHNLQTRQIGAHYAINMHVRMNGNLTLHEAHEKATLIEEELRAAFGKQTNITIHVEPQIEL